MLKEDFVFPPPPERPMSVLALIALGFETYKSSFGFCCKLLWFPFVLFLVSDLPGTFFSDYSLQLDNLPKLGGVFLWWALFGTLGLWNLVLRLTAIKRMALTPELEFVPAIAFANRLGWKVFVIRMATMIFQISSVVAVIMAGCIYWTIKPGLSIPFVGFAAVMVVFSYFGYFWSEFFYACFSVLLVTERSEWKFLLKRSLSMTKRAFLKGCNFSFAMEFLMMFAMMILSPVLMLSLFQLASHGFVTCVESETPLWISVADDFVQLFVSLAIIPLVAIWYAYFVNDLRLRLNLHN
ncbi:MAG: hypothetical protein C0469_06050 [Cyanobacteria bacterium DS2.3.42]|nr:hypothetical protein [Cyanobacteria bacterium DS2.3.42]